MVRSLAEVLEELDEVLSGTLSDDLCDRPDAVVREQMDDLLALRQKVESAVVVTAGTFEARRCADAERLGAVDYLAGRGRMTTAVGDADHRRRSGGAPSRRGAGGGGTR